MAYKMALKTLMDTVTIDPDFTGVEIADDIVFAINTTPNDESSKVSNYVVGELAAKGIESSLNAETQESTYIRAGKSTTKTGTQRTFQYEADRYVGDPFQDYCLSKKYATGQDVITDYVYFNIKNGKGEKGKVSIIVESDGGGNAGENSTVSINFNKVGSKPVDYTWEDDSAIWCTSKDELKGGTTNVSS